MYHVPPPGFVAAEYGPAYHTHRCRECGHVWKHTDAAFQNVKAHTCPECGSGPYWYVHRHLPRQPLTRKAPTATVGLTGKAPLNGTERLERVALGVTIVAGIFGVAALLGSVAETTRQTRQLIRPKGTLTDDQLAMLQAMEDNEK